MRQPFLVASARNRDHPWRKPVAMALMLCATSMSSAGDTYTDRIEALERKLEQALEVVEGLKREVEALKGAANDAQPVGANPPELELRLSEVEERVEDTEELASDLDERVGSRAVVNAFDAVELDFGGFLDLATTHVEGEDSSATSFNRQVFEILLGAELSDRWSLFVAQAFVRKSSANFSDRRNPDFGDLGGVTTDTVIAWGNYRHNELFNLRAGRFITPHGIINIEHFPALLLDPEQPQFLRPFVGQTIFPNFSDGFQVHGSRFLGADGDNHVQYHVYTGNFAGNATEFNYGGRVAWTLGSSGLTLGSNLATGSRIDEFDSDYYVYGADVLYDKDKVLWKSELFFADEDRGDDRFAFYTQPAWRFDDRWTVFYRFDYLDAGSDPLTLRELGQSTENVLGLSFRPNPNVHLRNIWTYKSFDSTRLTPSADAWLWELSATFSF